MELDYLFITAQITRKAGTAEHEQLAALYASGERVHGLVDQFPWMPFVVESIVEEGCATTFNLKMLKREKPS